LSLKAEMKKDHHILELIGADFKGIFVKIHKVFHRDFYTYCSSLSHLSNGTRNS